MKPKSFAVARALAVCALIAALAVFALAQDKNKAPQVSKGEQEAMMKVQSAADPAAKIKAAEEFIKKYPKSTNRAGVVTHVIGDISNVPDAAQKTTSARKRDDGLQRAGGCRHHRAGIAECLYRREPL
jgi:hypothetical protein